ncbi:segregation and condensation protein A [Sulfuriroseicoccus oceanibius]|uniref:segregation and condensation protein A n=1 Tax=Sulfuriroseicoccus oceanibius TaxID=2707525 RepID=UPI0013B7D9B3|nr:segregation/condensation protein A [Sulfuriroseicoccus oceanibius]
MEEPSYKVKLDIFEGPLDLLLYLIKRDEVDIYDIPIEHITHQYLDYMQAFKMLDIDLASEFMLMAANLMYIKSRTLLPKAVQPPEEDGEEEDPRWELIRQLVEYKKFKDAAGFLSIKELEQSQYFAAYPEPAKNPTPADPHDQQVEVNIFDLIRAFKKVLRRFEEEHTLGEIHDEPFTVGDKIDYLLDIMAEGESTPFVELFSQAASRSEVIVTFLAVLELMKMNQFRISQPELLGDIVVTRRKID